MTALTTRLLVNAGTPPTFSAASTSDTAEYGTGKDTFAVYKNGAGASTTLTITVPGNTSYGQPLPDPAIVIGAGAEVWVPLLSAYDNGTKTKRATLNLSSATSVTVAVVRVGS